MRFILLLSWSCLALAAASPAPAPQLLGKIFNGITSAGQDLTKKTADAVTSAVDTGTSAVRGAVKVGTDTTKTAVAGAGAVGKGTLEGAANVGLNMLGVLGMVGDRLGPLGKPIKAVEEIGTKIIGVGVDAGNKAISLGGTITDQATDAANKLADITSGAIKDGTKVGTDLAQSWIDNFLAQLRTFLSLFIQ